MTRTRILVLITATCLVGVLILIFGEVGFRQEIKEEGAVATEPTAEGEERQPVFQLSGVVTKVSEDSFTLTVQTLGAGGEDLAPTERTILVTPETSITLVSITNTEESRKEMETFQKEMAEFQEAMKKFDEAEDSDEKGDAPTLPFPPAAAIKRSPDTISSIKPGQSVSIVSETDLRGEATITPKTVEVLQATETISAGG